MTTTADVRPVPPAEWRWFGNAAHFIGGHMCRFHMATLVGPWIVSTVGQYWPEESVRNIIANSRGVTLEGKGDARAADYMEKVGYEEIGHERTFETMVFRAGAPCAEPDCGCGMPRLDPPSELDSGYYNDAGAATRGHYALCEKWAAITVEQQLEAAS